MPCNNSYYYYHYYTHTRVWIPRGPNAWLTILLWQQAVISHLYFHTGVLPQVALPKINTPGPEADMRAGQLHADGHLYRQHLPYNSHLHPKMICQLMQK